MKQLSKLAVAFSLAFGCAQAFAAGSILVSEPGADGFNIQTGAFNGSSYEITRLVFDFSNTQTADGSYLVIDGTPDIVTNPANGSAAFFGSGAVFGFDFTSFNTFETFEFSWDPDSATDGNYGATFKDFVGGIVTAYTTNGLYSGSFQLVGNGPDVAAALSPVPEPVSSATFFAGLGVLGLIAARRRS